MKKQAHPTPAVQKFIEKQSGGIRKITAAAKMNSSKRR